MGINKDTGENEVFIPEFLESKDVQKRLDLAQFVSKRLEDLGQDPESEHAKWAVATLVGFTGADKDDVSHEDRLFQAIQLTALHEAFGGNGRLKTILAERASRVYRQTKELPSSKYSTGVGPRARGSVFEAISERMEIGSGKIIGPTQLEGRARSLLQKNPLELGMKKAEMVGQLVRNDVMASPSVKALGAEVYVHLPHEKESEKTRKSKAAEGALILRFDRNKKEWVADGGEIARQKADKVAEALALANERNSFWNKSLITPDAVLVSQKGELMGTVEAKCWQEREFRALVERLEANAEDEDKRLLLGGVFSIEGEDLNLILNLSEEYNFVDNWADLSGKRMGRPILVLRLTRNISDDLVERLNTQMLVRDLPIVIERLNFSADEIEDIALSLIKTPEFSVAMEGEFKAIAESKLLPQNRNQLLQMNLEARAFALGVQDLEVLNDEAPVMTLSVRDVIGDELRDVFRQDQTQAGPYGRTARTRLSRCKQLVADFEALKIMKKKRSK